MKRYSYTAEKAKREIEAYFASLEVPAAPAIEGAAGQQANSWEGEGAVEGCRIQGKLTVGKGSRVVNCHIGSEADVVIGDNCFVYRQTSGSLASLITGALAARAALNKKVNCWDT